MKRPIIPEDLNDKIFRHVVYPGQSSLDGSPCMTYTVSDILDEYWDHWSLLMLERFKTQEAIDKIIYPHSLLETCIMDWCAVNWAIEKSTDV